MSCFRFWSGWWPRRRDRRAANSTISRSHFHVLHDSLSFFRDEDKKEILLSKHYR